jgi:hypothetical protein
MIRTFLRGVNKRTLSRQSAKYDDSHYYSSSSSPETEKGSGSSSRGIKREIEIDEKSLHLPKVNPTVAQGDIARNIADFMLSLLQENVEFDRQSCFFGEKILQISMLDYVERLIHYTNVWSDNEIPGPDSTGVQCALLALHFLQRSNVQISPYSIHRLFATAFLIGLKYTSDFLISNSFWAKVGGFSLQETNRMELNLCSQLNWNCGVSPETYQELQERFKRVVTY